LAGQVLKGQSLIRRQTPLDLARVAVLSVVRRPPYTATKRIVWVAMGMVVVYGLAEIGDWITSRGVSSWCLPVHTLMSQSMFLINISEKEEARHPSDGGKEVLGVVCSV